MNEQQFIHQVEAMTHRLYRVSRSILRSDADCQDAVQSAIVKAWLNLSALRDESVFDRWLLKITINECRKLYRQNRRYEALPLTLPSAAPADAFWELTSNLHPKYRIPIELFYVEQYRTHEIAEILSIPVGTVKRRLHTARKLLKEGGICCE